MALTLVPEEIETYAARHSTGLEPLLLELMERTKKEFDRLSVMLSGQIEGEFLRTLIHAGGFSKVLELGTFTGFSALMMAGVLPDHGELYTCDLDPKAISIAREFFKRSPQGHKIKLFEGPALKSLENLKGPFDLIFIDADKTNYSNYYEAVLPKLSARGIIVVDNVLWSGRVLNPQDDDARAIAAFNDRVRQDSRVRCSLLTVRDGLMLIRKAI